MCALALLSVACGSVAPLIGLRAATQSTPVDVFVDRVQLSHGEGGDQRTFACDALQQTDTPVCVPMLPVEGVDWSTLPQVSTPAPEAKLSAPLRLGGRFDGCVLTVTSVESAGGAALSAPTYKPARLFESAAKALDASTSIDPSETRCNGALRPVLSWGATGRSVEVTVIWADQESVADLRTRYGPVTVVSRLVPA